MFMYNIYMESILACPTEDKFVRSRLLNGHPAPGRRRRQQAEQENSHPPNATRAPRSGVPESVT